LRLSISSAERGASWANHGSFSNRATLSGEKFEKDIERPCQIWSICQGNRGQPRAIICVPRCSKIEQQAEAVRRRCCIRHRLRRCW
jgi:hypothetical protein